MKKTKVLVLRTAAAKARARKRAERVCDKYYFFMWWMGAKACDGCGETLRSTSNQNGYDGCSMHVWCPNCGFATDGYLKDFRY